MMNFLRKQMKWVMAIIVVAFLLSTFLMYEGRGTRRTPTRNADGTMSDYEVAQINGRSFMRSELETRLRNYLSNYSSRTTESLDMAALYQTVLDQAVLDSQLAKEVEEQGIRVSDAEAEVAMKTYADTYYPTRETFYQVLAQSGIKVDDYKRTLARQMAVDTLLNRAIGDIEISEDKAVEFYDTMKGLIYSRPEGFMIHMADFNTNEKAENFRARLVNGESWDVIVSSDSIPSSDVINITREPVFLPSTALTMGTLSALISLDVNEVSPVFEVASEDYAVAVKTSHVEETVSPYDEVSGDIKTLLTQQEQRKRLSDYENELKAKANVVIHDQELFARPEVSADETPQFTIDDIALTETSPDIEVVSEEKSVEAETVTEPVKAPEVVSEEPEVTQEPVKESESAPEIVTPETPVEPEKAPEETPAVEVTPEVVSEEPAPEVTTEPEKVEQPVTPEETPAVEEVEKVEEPVMPEAEEVKESATVTEPTPEVTTVEAEPEVVKDVDEQKDDEKPVEVTPEIVSEEPEAVTPEAPAEPEKVEEPVTPVTEEPVPEAVEVEEIVKSEDIPLQEVVVNETQE